MKLANRNYHPIFFLGLVLIIILVQACNLESDGDRLHGLIDETEEFQEEENPFGGDLDDENRRDDQLWAESIEDHERRYEYWLDIYDRLNEGVDRKKLETNDQITYDSFLRSVNHRVKQQEYKSHLVPINHEGGFYNRLLGLKDRVSLENIEHYENYIDRLRAIPQYFDQHIHRMRKGVEEGYSLPSVIFVDDYTYYIETHIKEDPIDTDFFEPFENFPDDFTDEEKENLEDEAKTVIAETVMPAYRDFVSFLEDEYIPASRETIAATDLPDGDDYYNYLIEYHTTLPMTADEVHQTGLDEVKRIRGEMDEVIDKVEFNGSFEEFLEFLRTDSQFFVDEPNNLLKEAMWHSKRMDGKLPELFHLHNLPRRSYGVEPVPDHLAPRYTGGRYSVGGGDRAGNYWVNTYDLPSRTLYTLEALTYHEAVPGHHLQIGLHQEMDDLPRRVGGLTAYTEGWALYAEKLGLDAGLFDDPYSNFGRLTYEMWRACRLVVDTGMHALGWSRQQAIDFMTQNTALSHHEIDTEINRYISVPGQALAYKTGELKISNLREMAEERLGDYFDLRDFHEAILKKGPVSLQVLEAQVTSYVEEALEKAESE